ncbi:hypothetical protein [Natrinema sp. DC36]|nr:hypothetical protein [Natrinema sp. DC36]
MPDATIGRERTGRVKATVTNGAPSATISREAAGRVTATLDVHRPGESA